jgi:hypothetical protein
MHWLNWGWLMLLFGPLETICGIWLATSDCLHLERRRFLIVATFCMISLQLSFQDVKERISATVPTWRNVLPNSKQRRRGGQQKGFVQLTAGQPEHPVLGRRAETNAYVDNHYESSRFGLIGSAMIGGDGRRAAVEMKT